MVRVRGERDLPEMVGNTKGVSNEDAVRRTSDGRRRGMDMNSLEDKVCRQKDEVKELLKGWSASLQDYI